jgi:hypothetical protein
MAAPYIAYLPTSGCHNSRLCANVSSLVMRQKPTRSTVSNRHHTLALTAPTTISYTAHALHVFRRPWQEFNPLDVEVCGCTGSAHRCRRFNDTNLSRSYDLPDTSKAPTLMVLSRSTEGLSAPLASLYTVFFGGISVIRLSSYRHKALTFPLG